MRRWTSPVLAAILFLAMTMACAAQDQAPGNTTSGSTGTAGGTSAQGPAQENSADSKDKKKKKDKKDKKKADKGEDALNAEVFSAAVAEDLLGQIRDGLEGHMDRTMLRAFDSDKMEGYISFEDQLQAFFQRYSEFRVHFRLAQTTTEGSKGVLLVDAELEQIPRDSGAPQRKRDQLRFEVERGRKGWKIVDFSPRQFFS